MILRDQWPQRWHLAFPFHPVNACSMKRFLKLDEGSRPQCIMIRGKCASPAHRDRRGSCQIIFMPKSWKSFQMGFLCSVLVGEVELVAEGCVFQRWRPPSWPPSKLFLTMHSLLQVIQRLSFHQIRKWENSTILVFINIFLPTRVGSSRKQACCGWLHSGVVWSLQKNSSILWWTFKQVPKSCLPQGTLHITVHCQMNVFGSTFLCTSKMKQRQWIDEFL